MRSKEVEEAIEQLIVDINFSETGCSTGIIDVNNIETVLSYIETLEKLPNTIRDKIKELDETKQYWTEEVIDILKSIMGE